MYISFKTVCKCIKILKTILKCKSEKHVLMIFEKRSQYCCEGDQDPHSVYPEISKGDQGLPDLILTMYTNKNNVISVWILKTFKILNSSQGFTMHITVCLKTMISPEQQYTI